MNLKQMNLKERLIEFTISLAASIGFEGLKSTVEFMKAWQISPVTICIILFLSCISISEGLKLYKYTTILNKINIGGKEYYDIFEDIVYYQTHEPRNIIKIDKLKWEFEFKYNPQCSTFLDLYAEWEVLFTAHKKRIREVDVGIHGGDSVIKNSNAIEAYQEKSKVNCKIEEEQDDCAFLRVNLATDIEKKERTKINLKYIWKEFMLTVRKDDYIYIYPHAHAYDMEQFELLTVHPYECKAKIVILRYQIYNGYNKIEVDNEFCNTKYKIEMDEKGYAKKHKIVFNEIGVKNVYLVIFERKS